MTDSTIVMKDEAGQDIRLTLLRTPVDLDCVTVEQEGDVKKETIKVKGKLQTEAKKSSTNVNKETDLDNVEVENEGDNYRQKVKFRKKLLTKRRANASVKINKRDIRSDDNDDELFLGKDTKKAPYKINVSLLKEPVAIDVQWNQDSSENSKTFKVKTVKKEYLSLRRKQRASDFEAWKQNALIIFESSYVYPFIHVGGKYKCFVCARRYIDAESLRHHTVNDHITEEIKKQLTNRVRDKNIKVDVSRLECKICQETVSDLQNLKIHLSQHGKKFNMETADGLIPFRLNGEVFDCQICGEQFQKLRLLIIHMSKHYNNFSCEICGSVFISLKLLKRHLQVHKSGSFPCQKCDKIFSSSSKRSMHVRGVHLKQHPRTCPICTERFNSNYQRAKHLRMVHNQSTGLYRCESCSREYDLKYHLLVHIRSVHLQERNQECPICNSRFFSKYSLARHMVVHTGEKNHKCQYCGKAYARRKNLLEHLRSHEAVASFAPGGVAEYDSGVAASTY